MKIIHKVCNLCNREYLAKSPDQRYCCKKCRLSAMEKSITEKKNHRYNPKCGQICWRCENSTGGCSWSRGLKPIDGWRATKVKRDDCEDFTYKILYCPLFKEEMN